MRRTATVLALSTALLAPAGASAQESPSPVPTPFDDPALDCSQVAEEEGGCPSPSPSPSPTATRPHHTPPMPSPSQTAHMDCGPVIEPFDSPVPAWGLDGSGGVTLVIKGHPRPEEHKGTEVVVVGYVRPGTETKELGRAPVDEDGRAHVVLRLTGSSRLVAHGGGCFFSSTSTVVPVKARLGGLHAYRSGPRDYTFSTFYAGPDGKVGTLYRVTSDGREVLTSQTRMRGEFVSIRRTFLGSGRFGFVLRTGDDVNSLGASTNVRDTVIH